jgi:actin related protein 2/3 complex, subunit 5
MKYLYKNLEKGENSKVLFKWHEVLTSLAGTGCIVRSLADKDNIL